MTPAVDKQLSADALVELWKYFPDVAEKESSVVYLYGRGGEGEISGLLVRTWRRRRDQWFTCPDVAEKETSVVYLYGRSLALISHSLYVVQKQLLESTTRSRSMTMLYAGPVSTLQTPMNAYFATIPPDRSACIAIYTRHLYTSDNACASEMTYDNIVTELESTNVANNTLLE